MPVTFQGANDRATVIDIGATIGDDCQVGALSFVPKHHTLEPGATYAGIPVR